MIAQLGVFVAVTGGALVLFRLSSGRGPDRARFRARLEAEFAPDASGPGPLYKDLDALESSQAAAPPADGHDGPSVPALQPAGWSARGTELLRQAGLPLTPQQFLTVAAGVGAVAGGLAAVFAGPLPAAAAAVAGVTAPFAAANIRRRRRGELYVRQVAGAFELMARVLRAGQAVPEAFRAAVEAFDDPLAGEFGRCLHQIEHGLRPDAAFRELSDRAGILELRIFVVAMTIQRQTGGNLSEVLDRLATVVRARLRVRQKIRALTAEGRMQSLTLTVLPALVFAAMYALNRTYAESLLTQWKLLAAAVGCVTVGSLWIRSIMNFEG